MLFLDLIIRHAAARFVMMLFSFELFDDVMPFRCFATPLFARFSRAQEMLFHAARLMLFRYATMLPCFARCDI